MVHRLGKRPSNDRVKKMNYRVFWRGRKQNLNVQTQGIAEEKRKSPRRNRYVYKPHKPAHLPERFFTNIPYGAIKKTMYNKRHTWRNLFGYVAIYFTGASSKYPP